MIVDAISPCGRTLVVDDVAHCGEIVLIEAAIPPISPPVGKSQVRAGDARRNLRNDLIVAQHGEGHVERTRDAPENFIGEFGNSILVPDDNAFQSTMGQKPVLK